MGRRGVFLQLLYPDKRRRDDEEHFEWFWRIEKNLKSSQENQTHDRLRQGGGEISAGKITPGVCGEEVGNSLGITIGELNQGWSRDGQVNAKKMARTKMTPRKTIADVITPQEYARRFRTFTYNRDWKATFGEFLAKYFALWEDAKDYVTDYEASECLINQLPRCWRVWAETQMGELVFKDSITGALRCHFPNLVRRLFDQWIIYGNPPNTTVFSAGLSHREVSEHVCSNGNNVFALQPRNNDMEVGPSTKIVLRRGLSGNEVVEVPTTRELARKEAHDSAGCALDVRACGKHSQHGGLGMGEPLGP